MSKRIQIFRPGKHTTSAGQAIEFSASDVESIAASYDPAVGHAPIVVGHPKQDSPAYGWVRDLSVSDGHLVAELDQVNPDFSEAVKSGAYKHVSAAFYAPNSKANPKPGSYYLRHVGFLGAQPPAIKGLQPVEFAEGAAADVEIEIEFSEAGDSAAGPTAGSTAVTPVPSDNPSPSELPGSDGSEPSPPPTPVGVQTDHPASGQPKTPAVAEAEPGSAKEAAPAGAEGDSPEAKLAELARKEAELDARLKALAAAEQAAKRTEATAFAESMVGQGRLLPRDRSGLVEVLLAMPAVNIEFAEGGKQQSIDPAKWLREFVSQAPQRIEFSELAAGDIPEPDKKAAQARIEARIPAIIEEHTARGEPINHMRAAAIAALEIT